MMCYQDRMFCPGHLHGCVRFKECPRALTERIRKDASEAGIPISQPANPAGLECFWKGFGPKPKNLPGQVSR